MKNSKLPIKVIVRYAQNRLLSSVGILQNVRHVLAAKKCSRRPRGTRVRIDRDPVRALDFREESAVQAHDTRLRQ